MTNCARPGFAIPCGTCDACKEYTVNIVPTASPEHDFYPISFLWTDPETGYRWLHLKLDAPFDYDQVKKLPAALANEGIVYVRTGWNSDKGEVYYRAGMPAAQDIFGALKNAKALLDTPVGRRKFSSEFECDVRDSINKAFAAIGEW